MQFRERLEISGRGTVLVYDLQSGDRFPAVGHRIYHDGHEYEVSGVELSRKMTDPPYLSARVGLVVRKVQ